MDDTLKPAQNVDPDQVSVPVGSTEGQPAEIAPRTETAKDFQKTREQVQPSEQLPQVDGEVKDYIKVKKDHEIDNEARKAGVQDSIPAHPAFKPMPTDPVIIKKQQEGSVGNANTWIGFLAEKVKYFKDTIVGKEKNLQEAN